MVTRALRRAIVGAPLSKLFGYYLNGHLQREHPPATVESPVAKHGRLVQQLSLSLVLEELKFLFLSCLSLFVTFIYRKDALQ